MKQLSLRPYTGKLYLASSKKDYELAHKKLFKTPDVLSCNQIGRFSGGEGKDGMWTYLVYGDTQAALAHEFAHVIFHVFENCNIPASSGNEEPFCYLLSQLMLDSKKSKS